MLHHWILVWFDWVQNWGYIGIFVLMAMESSIIPVPSEVVMPPAAFWAAQGKFSFLGVVIAGTLGSLAGSALSYFAARVLGLPFVHKYGKYVLLSPKKVEMAESWVSQYGVGGIFVARLLPVVRHLISIPAGLFRMSFLKFAVVTTLGSALWCTVLSWYGEIAIGAHPELLNSPEEMIHVIKSQLSWFVAGVIGFTLLYLVTKKMASKAKKSQASAPVL